MKTAQLTALAAAAFLALTLAGCTTSAPVDTGTDTGTSTDSDNDSDAGSGTDDGFAGVTLAGTGDYSAPDQAPIGGYELPDYQDALPDGCTWTTYEDDAVLGDGETNGQFVFVTDRTTRFVTDGCPDWVQFQ